MAKKKPTKKDPSGATDDFKTSAPAAQKPAKDFFHRPEGIGSLCLILGAMVLWCFWPAVGGQFLFYDEFGTLVCNTRVNTGLTWHGVAWAMTAMDYNQWIPLAWVSHMLDYQFYGTNPWGHHLTNILIHAASSVTLFLVLRKMTGTMWRSLIVAAIFAFHPLRVESVAWVSERKDVLSVLFGLLSLWTYAEYVDRVKTNRGRTGLFYGLTFLLFAFSLLSKQTLVTFPCLLWLLDFWPFDRWKRSAIPRLVLEKIPFLIVLPFVSKISYLAQLQGGALKEMSWLPWDARLENALVSYGRYLGKFFWPADLSIFYSHPIYWPGQEVFLAGLLVVMVSAAAWLLRREVPYFFVGWFWFAGTMVPVLGFVQLFSLAMADRFTYMPCIGITIVMVWGIHALTRKWPTQARIAGVVTGTVLVACVIQTRHLIPFWKDNETVLRRAEAVDANNYVAPAALGYLLSMSPGGSEQAYNEFQKSAAINPRFIQAQYFVGDGLLQRGHLNEAIAHLYSALLIDPLDNRSTFDSGMAYFQKGKTKEGITLCQQALFRDTGNLQFMGTLGMMLAQVNRLTEAIPLFQKMCIATPNDPNAFNNLGIALAKSGQFDGAIAAFQNALKLAPGSTQLQGNLNATIQAKQQAAMTKPAGNSNTHALTPD